MTSLKHLTIHGKWREKFKFKVSKYKGNKSTKSAAFYIFPPLSMNALPAMPRQEVQMYEKVHTPKYLSIEQRDNFRFSKGYTAIKNVLHQVAVMHSCWSLAVFLGEFLPAATARRSICAQFHHHHHQLVSHRNRFRAETWPNNRPKLFR